MPSDWERRNERAREQGFASEYDRRMRQGDLERDRPSGEQAEYLRGHRGEAYIRDYAREGDAVMVGDERDAAGRFTTLHYYPEDPAREPRTISIRGMTIDDIHDLLDDLADEGVAIAAGYLEE